MNMRSTAGEVRADTIEIFSNQFLDVDMAVLAERQGLTYISSMATLEQE